MTNTTPATATEKVYARIHRALVLMEKGIPLVESTKEAKVSPATLGRYAKKSLVREAPTWIYERFAKLSGKYCDTCNELLLPGEWLSRKDEYAGQEVTMFWCDAACQEEWDRGALEAEEGMTVAEALD